MLTLTLATLLVFSLTLTAQAATTTFESSWANPVNRNLYRLAVCETGGINNGKPLWTHHNSTYAGALGFAHSTWTAFRDEGMPTTASSATPGDQYRVGRKLVARYHGYSSWPSCHRRLGLPG